jgi:hypothetical protein
MTDRLESTFFIPSNFKINQVPTAPPGQAIAAAVPRVPAPSLGPLAGFAGTWNGNGFNTIFRPPAYRRSGFRQYP